MGFHNIHLNITSVFTDLSRRQNWNISYGMLAIVSKTRTMNLRSGLEVLNNTTLESGSKRKDLVVTISSNLNWENHVDVRFNPPQEL